MEKFWGLVWVGLEGMGLEGFMGFEDLENRCLEGGLGGV